MSQCGSIGFVDGGTITNSSLINSQMTNSTVQASDVTSSNIKTLASIDEASAKVLADALTALPAASLTALAAALVAAQTEVESGAPVEAEDFGTTPTSYYGAGDAMLTSPDTWLQKGNYVVPAYRSV